MVGNVIGAIFGLSSVIADRKSADGSLILLTGIGSSSSTCRRICSSGIHHSRIAAAHFQRPCQDRLRGNRYDDYWCRSLLLALSLGGKNYPWASWQIIGMFVVAIVSLVWFIRIESRTSEPILPMHLFKNGTFTKVNGIGFFMSLGMFGAVVFVPLFMQGIVGISATASGTVTMPMMLSLIAASIIGGQFVYKIGVRRQMVAGMIIAAVSFLFLSTMDQSTTRLLASLYMIIMGIGIGRVMPLLTLILQESFKKEELGVVTSSSQFFRSIGGTFGITILGVL